MNVGVLALQGDFREHLVALAECGTKALTVKSLAELNSIDRSEEHTSELQSH